MGAKSKIRSRKQLDELWEAYKTECDSKMVLTHDFSSKNSEFVSKELRKSVTYTIEGFCVFAKISRSYFYDTIAVDERFADMVTCMKEECEVDAREKFELGVIPTQLSGLWMSRHGYTNKVETDSGGAEALKKLLEAVSGVE